MGREENGLEEGVARQCNARQKQFSELAPAWNDGKWRKRAPLCPVSRLQAGSGREARGRIAAGKEGGARQWRARQKQLVELTPLRSAHVLLSLVKRRIRAATRGGTSEGRCGAWLTRNQQLLLAGRSSTGHERELHQRNLVWGAGRAKGVSSGGFERVLLVRKCGREE